MLRFDFGGGCEDRASRVDVDSIKFTEDEDGVSESSGGRSSGREWKDSEGCGKMNAGVLASPLRINEVRESETKGCCGYGLP